MPKLLEETHDMIYLDVLVLFEPRCHEPPRAHPREQPQGQDLNRMNEMILANNVLTILALPSALPWVKPFIY